MAVAPVMTLSGAAFPVKTAETAGAAIAKGDIVMQNLDGKWDPEGNAVALNVGPVGVALHAAAADGDSIDICLCTPDVVFEATAPHNAYADMDNEGPWTMVGTSGSAGVADADVDAANELRGIWYKDHADTGKLYITIDQGGLA